MFTIYNNTSPAAVNTFVFLTFNRIFRFPNVFCSEYPSIIISATIIQFCTKYFMNTRVTYLFVFDTICLVMSARNTESRVSVGFDLL